MKKNSDLRRKRIILVNIFAYDYTALGLLCLVAALRNNRRFSKKGEVSILEFNIDRADEEITRRILNEKPDILGATIYSWNAHKVFKILNKIKKIDQKIFIICGGPEITCSAPEIMRNYEFLDAAIVGMGEITFLNFCNAYLYNAGLDGIENLCYRTKDKRIVTSISNIRAQKPNNRILPSPYSKRISHAPHITASLETSRGCRKACSFCLQNFPLVRFPVSRIFKDIDYLLNNYKQIYIADSNFASDLTRGKKVLRYIAKNNRKKTNFYTELSAEDIDQEFARLLRKANFVEVGIGLQSADGIVLRNIGRIFFDRKRFIRGIKLLKENGIKVQIEIIFGLPGQTPDSFKRTFEFADKLRPEIIKSYCLNLFPNTRIRKEADQKEWLVQKQTPYYLIKNEYFSQEDIIWFRKFSNFVFLFYKNEIIKRILKETGTGFFDLFKELAGWCRRNGCPNRSFMNIEMPGNSVKKWKKFKENMQGFLLYFLSRRKADMKKQGYLVLNGTLYNFKRKLINL